MDIYITNSELYHFGVKGMKWGVRKKRYYNSDGSLNTSGKQKQLKDKYKAEKKAAKDLNEWANARSRYIKGIEKTYSKKYNPAVLQADRKALGRKAVNRINDKINAGQSYKKAYAEESAKAYAKGMAASVAMMAVPYIATMTYKAFSKYANERAIQKANESLGKLGYSKLKHIAGNVYERVTVYK